jgi:hypothetical protein
VNQRRATRDAGTAAKLQLAALEPHYVIGSFERVGIAVWIDEAPVAAIRDAEAMLAQLSTVYPEGIAFLQVIGEDNPGIEPEARAALTRLLQTSRSFLREAPVVYEGDGFRAASFRAIVTGLLKPRTMSFSQRVYSTLETASLAIAKQFEKREPTRYSRALCEAMSNLRDQHRHRYPSAPRSFIRYKG